MKKCAVINDISSFGKCSLTAAMPIMSVMGLQVCPVVTGVFSAQTDYDSYKSADLTDFMPSFTEEWRKMGAEFDAILTGFILSEKQSEYINSFIDIFRKENTLLVVDPVMADHGKLYDTYNEAMVEKMKSLIKRADVITPNISELKLLSGEEDIEKGAKRLLSLGTKAVIVTGIVCENKVSNFVFTKERKEAFESEYTKMGELGGSFSGTGDIFSSFITGRILCGDDVFAATKKATEFISAAIKASNITNRNDGIDFESVLKNIS